MHNNSSISLKSKVLNAHLSPELSGFLLPEYSYLLIIQRNEISRQFEVQANALFSNTTNYNGEAIKIEDYSSLHEALSPKGSFQVKAEKLPPVFELPNTSKNGELQIVPLSLLSSAKAYLLFPKDSNDPDFSFQHYFTRLSEIVEKCLFEFLEMRYTPQFLYSFRSIEALVENYNASIAEWLCPYFYECSVQNTNIHYLENYWSSSNRFILNISSEEGQIAETIFNLPSHGYPVNGEPDHVYQIDSVNIRKHLLAIRLSSFFKHIYRYWNYKQQSYQLNSRQVDSVIGIIREIQYQVNTYDQKLTSKISELKNILDEKYIPARFAFFLSEHKQWNVTFDHNNCSAKSTSRQGMACIQYLLSNPGERINPQDLYREVQDKGLTYKTENSKATVDKTLDRVNLIEAKETFGAYLPLWQEIKKKEEKKLDMDDLKVLQYLLYQIDVICTHEPNRTDLMRRRVKMKRMVKKMIVILGLDDNFVNNYSYVLKEAKPTGNRKNRLDSLRSGIKRAILVFESVDTDLYKYLTETIILTNNQNSNPDYRPFMFVPSLASDENFVDITWDTEGKGS